jgi:alpha-ketoglutarate-dependent 2,4-dichlorophenoxyacetate dioxygenase
MSLLTVAELPRCGGAVASLDRPHRPLAGPDLARLRALLESRGVLLLRGCCATVEEFASLCRGLGPLFDDVNGPGRRRPELGRAGSAVHFISNLDLATNVAMEGPTSMLSEANHEWHADYSWEPAPSRFTALFGLEVSAGGGAKTQIASTRHGFQTLPVEMQARCHGRVVLHRPGGAHASEPASPNFAGTDHTAAGLQAARDAAAARGADTDTDTAVVDNHIVETVRRPLLLRGALLLGRHAYRIEGPGGEDEDEDEHEDGSYLLTQLTAHCLNESLVYTHEWRDGDVLLWDNEATLHRAVPGISGTRRHMARTVIAELADSAPVTAGSSTDAARL